MIQIESSGRRTSSEPIVGIDLGTTNSLVAQVAGGHPVVLTSRDGERLVPSVVTLDGGELRIGTFAKNRKVLDPKHTIFSVKRLLGRSYEDVKGIASTLPYEIVPESGLVKVRLGGKSYTAIEISAMILRELKKVAEQSLGREVTKAVITVPAYFNDSQRQATRAAGRLAGWDVLRIINEPTAASLAYGLYKKREGLIAVYDLGGGTFDVSILKLHDGIFEVLATNGNTALGGDDLDQVLAGEARREIREARGFDPFADAETHAALLGAAERAKIALSTAGETKLELDVRGQRYSKTWTRSSFEKLARSVLEETRKPCLNALKDAGLKPEDLTDVVMVGGPTRLPAVQQIAREIFGREPNTSVHPDEVVAQGAAIQADILAGNNRDFLLLDVVPLSLGIETYGGLMSTLIPRNTRIPTVAREGFTTFIDNQTGVDIHVLQGERERVEDNRSLARFKLKGIQPAPAGTPRVEVTFLVDADGILQVAAKDQQTGNEQTIEVKPSYGLTDSEVERMLSESMEHAAEDISYRQLVEARTKAEPVLRAVESKLPDAERLLPPGEVHVIRAKMGELSAALAGTDPARIAEASSALNQATVRLAELIVKDAILKAQGAQ